jgi:hypothetical protein
MTLPIAIIALLLVIPSALAESNFDGLWKRVPIVLPNGTAIDPYFLFC